MKAKSWKAIEKKLFTREEIAEAERYTKREILEMNLLGLRQAAGRTQKSRSRSERRGGGAGRQ